MSDINKSPIKFKLKEKSKENKFYSKGIKISSKKVNNNKKKKNNQEKVSLDTLNNERLNNHKKIINERKLNSSISSRNKGNIFTISNTLHQPNQIINQKDFSTLFQKKLKDKNYEQKSLKTIDLNYDQNKEIKEQNNCSNNYVNNFNNNFINIKNIKIGNEKNKLYKLEVDDLNTIINNKNLITDIDSETIHSYSLLNNKGKMSPHSLASNINNLFNNNNINVKEFIKEDYKSKNVNGKENLLEKDINGYSIKNGESLSSIGSLMSNISKTINANSSPAKNIIKSFYNKNNAYNYSNNTLNSNYNLTKRQKTKNKSKNEFIFPIDIFNKKICSHSKKKFKHEPNSFFGGSRSVHNLPNISGEFRENKNNISLNDNDEKRNNSISCRKRIKTKSKEIGSVGYLIKKHDSPEIKRIKRIKIKINKKNDNNKNKYFYENKTKSKFNIISKKNSSSIFSTSIFQKNYKNKINEKSNNCFNGSLNFKNKDNTKLISNKGDINNKYTNLNSNNKIKKDKEIFNYRNKRKNNNNNFESYMSEDRYKTKYGNNKKKEKSPSKHDEVSKEALTSPITLASSRHSHKIIQREYPNMVLTTKKNEFLHPNNSQVVQKNKNISKKIKKIQSICKVGYSGQNIKKLNQDNFFIFPNFLNNPSYIFAGVCDGHGIFGQNISFYLKENLPKNLMDGFFQKNIQNLQEIDIIELSQIIDYIYRKTNNEMNEDERIDSSFSGSTSVSYIFTPERLFCINVGDSRCIIGKFNKNINEWTPMNLSRDHKPSDPNEKLRIIQSGGRVESLMDEEKNFVGPERVWLPNEDTPGLAMSRSFGDEVAHKVGVIVCPEIFDYHFDEDDKFIIVASDGIWEFMSSDEVVEIVKDFYLRNDLEDALDYLYNESSKRWISKEKIIDDITVIIAFLD